MLKFALAPQLWPVLRVGGLRRGSAPPGTQVGHSLDPDLCLLQRYIKLVKGKGFGGL